MQKAGEGELGVFANPLTIKAGKERSRGSAIETFVVIENFNFQSTPPDHEFPEPQGHFWRILGRTVKANRNDSFEGESQGGRTSGSVLTVRC
jgi:hypothetical protein